MTLFRWAIAIVLLVFSAIAIVGNLWIALGGLVRKRKKFESLGPFAGGIAGTIGLLLLPIARAHAFWWVPLVADLGCGPLLLAVVVEQMKKRLIGRHNP
jgi:hypothetical protein